MLLKLNSYYQLTMNIEFCFVVKTH